MNVGIGKKKGDKEMKRMINNILNRFGYYKLDDLQAHGHCGICGKPINEVLPKEWAWGICDDCIKE